MKVPKISRRDFLKVGAMAAGGGLVSSALGTESIIFGAPLPAKDVDREVDSCCQFCQVRCTTKVQIKGATHIEFSEHRALTIAKDILKHAIDNYENRGGTNIPDYRNALTPGFSHEYINYMLGGSYRASFRPLNDAVMSGRIRGVAAIVGCTNPRIKHDFMHTTITEALLKEGSAPSEYPATSRQPRRRDGVTRQECPPAPVPKAVRSRR